MKFEFFEVTADVGYKAYGKTIDEAFENAALAMFEVITDTSKIEAKIGKKIEIESEDLVALLYDWLTELLFLHDSEYMVFSKFKVIINEKNGLYNLKGVLWGEEFDLEIHEIREDVKAVTYHMMEVIEQDDGYMVQVILDI